jgi:hypothetical protein
LYTGKRFETTLDLAGEHKFTNEVKLVMRAGTEFGWYTSKVIASRDGAGGLCTGRWFETTLGLAGKAQTFK